VAIVLVAAISAALLALLPEGDPRRKIVSAVLAVLVLILIVQQMVEGRVTYRIPYTLSAAASILMIVAQSMHGRVVNPSSVISGILFAYALSLLVFQVRGLPPTSGD
jgi:uncharacterized membrane protein YjjP (DUF1212 family)